MAHALIIGGGVTGLTTAWCLLERGYQVTIIAKDYVNDSQRLTSQIAGALWEWPPAVCGRHLNEYSLERSKVWCTVSYKKFKELEGIASGVKFQMANFLFLEKVEHCAYQKHKMEEIKASCVEQFRHDAAIINEPGLDPTYGVVDAYQHLAPVVDTDMYMSWLTTLLKNHPRVRELKKETLSGDLLDQEEFLLDAYNAHVIINATGLGSKELAHDDTVYPLRGALLRMVNDDSTFPKIRDAICLSLDGRGEDAADMIFMIPRNETTLIVGGLAEPNQWDTNITMENHPPLREMYKRNVKLNSQLQKAKLDPDYPIAVGLRPFRRDNVRVEREKRLLKSKARPSQIVHNYGQGGAGFSLSFGCAQDAANIADAIIKEAYVDKKILIKARHCMPQIAFQKVTNKTRIKICINDWKVGAKVQHSFGFIRG